MPGKTVLPKLDGFPCPRAIRGTAFAGALVVAVVGAAAGAACSGPTEAAGPTTTASSSAAAAPAASAPLVDAAVAGAPPPAGAREGASVAVTPEGDLAIVADEDHQALDLVRLPVRDGASATHLETPGRPAQIVVVGHTVLVTIRAMPDGQGALLAYDRGTDPSGSGWKETARVALPPDAWGIAVSPDGSLAAVTSAWSAKVSIVDLAQGSVVAARDVAREPRGAVFAADGTTVYVSHLVGGDLTKIVNARGEATVSRVAFPASPLRSPAAEKLEGSLGYALVMTPTRDRLFAAREAIGALGSRAWFGAAAVDSLDVATETPRGTAHLVNAHSAILGPLAKDPNGIPKYSSAAADAIAEGEGVFAVPRAAVYRKSQRSILVASEGTDRIAELDATMSDPTIGVMHVYELATDHVPTLGVAAHGGAPTGIALSPDEKTAFIHCRSTDELAVIPLAELEGGFDAAPPRFVKLADDDKDADLVNGRRLFYAGTTGTSCSSCHPEGRDDGRVWHEVDFTRPDSKDEIEFTNLLATATTARHLESFWADVPQEHFVAKNAEPTGVGYARRTPMLVGRVKAIGPYGWHGEAKDLDARILRGFAIHGWGGNAGAQPGAVDKAAAYRLAIFLRRGLVPPPAPEHALTDEEQRGKAIFTSDAAACATCHTPQSDYTNRDVVPLSQVPPGPGFVADPNDRFKVPSLVFVSGHAPYFHDGRFATLDELVEKNGDRMGKTSQLSAEDKKALVAFLKTL